MTKEHIWPAWLSEHLDKNSPYHLYGTAYKSSDLPFTEEIKRRTGTIHSRKLRIVCGECNNGWMSRLQERVKPILFPLVSGENFDFSLSEAESKLLASWASMFTMVVEFADSKTAALTAEERKQFSLFPNPRDHWSIWIGRGPSKGGVLPWNFMHFGWRLKKDVPTPEAMPDKCHAQSTTFFVGDVFFFTYSSTVPILTFDANGIAIAAGIKTLWPFPGHIFNFKIRRLDGYEIHDLSRIFIRMVDPEYPEPTGWRGRPKS